MEVNGRLFETSRCIVRTFVEDDLNLFIEYRNNDDWMKFQSFKGLSKEEYKNNIIIPFTIEDGGQLAICDKNTNLLLGDLYIRKDNKEVSVGYTINPKHARLGYMFEVVNGLIDYLYSNYKDIDIIADSLKENKNSIALLLKLGFIQIAETKEEFYYQLKRTPLL